MTKENAGEFLPLLKAYSEGKTIQYEINRNGVFIDADTLTFNDLPSRYRIKPEPKLRAWTASEVPLGAWVRLKNNHNSSVAILSWLTSTDCGSSVGEKHLNFSGPYDHVLKYWEHSTDNGKTWAACGIVETT